MTVVPFLHLIKTPTFDQQSNQPAMNENNSCVGVTLAGKADTYITVPSMFPFRSMKENFYGNCAQRQKTNKIIPEGCIG
ncbi:MAG: hypothetical protein WAS33_21915 [Candidatus Promineifilaceae bacterium]|nr:hypothetical protein [Anaerolineaceae bacterium]